MQDNDISSADSETLAAALDMARTNTFIWTPEELSQVWRHLLRSSIRVTMSSRPQLLESDGKPIPGADVALEVLLGAPAPSSALLAAVKEFAKPAEARGEETLPLEIARALYLAVIACAKVRSGLAISSLSPEKLGRGMKWMLQQTWLDPATIQLAERAASAQAE